MGISPLVMLVFAGDQLPVRCFLSTKFRAQRNPKEEERQRQLAFMEGFTHLVSAQRRVQRPGGGTSEG